VSQLTTYGRPPISRRLHTGARRGVPARLRGAATHHRRTDREAYLSTVEAGPQAAARVSRPHGDRRRPQGVGQPAGQGAQAPLGLTKALRLAAPGRLKRRAEFLRIAAKGRKAVRPGLVLQALPRQDQAALRLGFTVTKKIGNAVTRNRTRRRLKEAARLALAGCEASGFDLVLIGRAATRSRSFSDLQDDVRRALAKAGVA
jgi:ribonuclease P protein component